MYRGGAGTVEAERGGSPSTSVFQATSVCLTPKAPVSMLTKRFAMTRQDSGPQSAGLTSRLGIAIRAVILRSASPMPGKLTGRRDHPTSGVLVSGGNDGF